MNLNIVQIAKLVGVSKSTVSRVLNGENGVKPETRKKIMSVIEDHGYVPNYHARGLKGGAKPTIGVLVPDLDNLFYSQFYHAFCEIIFKENCMSFICMTGNHGEFEREVLTELYNRKLDALVIWNYEFTDESVQLLNTLSQNIPVIYLNPFSKLKDDNSFVVTFNGFQGVYNAYHYLHERGRKRVAMIKDEPGTESTRSRYEGFLKAKEDLNIINHEELIMEGGLGFEFGYKATAQLMALPEPPDAIIAATDLLAIGALKYLNQHRIKVPEQVSLIGFDNISMTEYTEPALTTIEMPVVKMSEKTIDIISNAINNRSAKNTRFIIDCELIKRDSA